MRVKYECNKAWVYTLYLAKYSDKKQQLLLTKLDLVQFSSMPFHCNSSWYVRIPTYETVKTGSRIIPLLAICITFHVCCTSSSAMCIDHEDEKSRLLRRTNVDELWNVDK